MVETTDPASDPASDPAADPGATSTEKHWLLIRPQPHDHRVRVLPCLLTGPDPSGRPGQGRRPALHNRGIPRRSKEPAALDEHLPPLWACSGFSAAASTDRPQAAPWAVRLAAHSLGVPGGPDGGH
jgi:hypothetical protein